MVPHNLGNGSERGYYIFFDINLWERQRVSDDTESMTRSIYTCQADFNSENSP